ncbi:hypothetical protein D3C77_771940 [compost metagenome]
MSGLALTVDLRGTFQGLVNLVIMLPAALAAISATAQAANENSVKAPITCK